MADGLRKFSVEILGDAKGLVKSAKESEGALGGLANHLKLVGGAIAGAFAIHEVSKFGKESVDAFKEVGGEVKTLTRITGGSAESMSHLRFAAEEVGISSDQLGKAIGIASKAIESGKDHFDKLGVATHDLSGHLRPMEQVLQDTAEKFKNMPDGIEKTGLAMQLFGKSGKDLIPLLNQGKEGMAEFAQEADKLGLTLTAGNLEALKKTTMAHREMHAAVEGLKVQIGAELMPVIATMTTWFAEKLPGAMQIVNSAIRDVLGPTLYSLVEIFGKLTTGFEALVNGEVVAGDFWTQLGVTAGELFLELEKVARAVGHNHAAMLILKVAVGGLAVAAFAMAAPFYTAAVMILGMAVALQTVIDKSPKLQDAFGKAADFMSNHSKAFTDTAVALAGMAASFLLLAKATEAIQGVSKITGAFQALGPAMSLIMAGGIPLLIVAAVVAIGVAAYEAYEHIKPFHDFVDKVGRLLREEFGVAVEWVSKTLLPALSAAFDATVGVIAGSFDTAQSAVGGFFSTIGSTASAAMGAFMAAIQPTIDYLNQHVFPLFAALADVIAAAWDRIVQVTAFQWALIAPLVTAALQIIETTISLAMTAIADVVHAGLDILRGLWDVFFAVVTPVIQTAVAGIETIWNLFMDNLKEVVGPVLRLIGETITAALDVIRGIFRVAADLIHGDWSKAWDDLKAIVDTVWGFIKTIVKTGSDIVFGTIDTFLKDIVGGWRFVWTAMGSIAEGIWDGVKSAVKSGLNAVIDAVNAAIDILNGLQIHIPSVGVGPIRTPGFDWGGLGLGHVPRLADGGIIRARPGGTLAILGEAGRDEAVVPLNGNGRMIGGTQTIQLVVDGRVLAEVVADHLSGGLAAA